MKQVKIVKSTTSVPADLKRFFSRQVPTLRCLESYKECLNTTITTTT